MLTYNLTPLAGRFVAGRRLSPGQTQITLTADEAQYELLLGTIVLAGVQPPQPPAPAPVLDDDIVVGRRGSAVWSATLAQIKAYVGTVAGATWATLNGKPATFPPAEHDHVIGDTAGLQAALDAKADMLVGVDTMTAGFVVAAGDLARVKRCNTAAAVNVTLPANLPVGFNVAVTQAGAGQITIIAGAGASLRSQGGHARSAAQHAVITAIVVENVGGNAAAWLLSGGLAA